MKTLFLSFMLIFCIPAFSLAHPGNTDSRGGHTCRTNCAKWGLSTGQYHFHTPKKAVQKVIPKPIQKVAPASSSKKVYVKGYYRANGTYVQGYWRN